jgi:hypothetical protein
VAANDYTIVFHVAVEADSELEAEAIAQDLSRGIYRSSEDVVDVITSAIISDGS